MSMIVFLLIMAICLGLIYLVHKYFEKEQFYLIGIIYSIVSFLMSFKMINILGMDINANLIFSSGLLAILYYVVNRYGEKESKRFILTVSISMIICLLFFLIAGFMVPSIYDKMSIFYQNIVFDNLPIFVLYPISLTITMFLSEYCFRELKKEEKKELLKTILTIFGIIFIDSCIFIYFSYAFIIKFDTALVIALDNYLVKVGIMIIYILIVNKLFMVRKVK